MTDWRDSAACLGLHALFDAATPSEKWGVIGDHDAVTEALAICAGCSVRDTCATELGDDPWLIAGGTTPRGRHDRARFDTTTAHECDDCGALFETARGLAMHRPVHHLPCPACDRRCPTERALSLHWVAKHRDETGTCIRGHKVSGGRCRGCLEIAAVRGRANRKKRRAA